MERARKKLHKGGATTQYACDNGFSNVERCGLESRVSKAKRYTDGLWMYGAALFVSLTIWNKARKVCTQIVGCCKAK